MIEKASVPRAELVSALRSLESIVLSLDRIGSLAPDLDEDEQARIMMAFIQDWDVAKSLSEVRRILSQGFSDAVGADGMDELERELQGVQYWAANARKPLRSDQS